MKKIMNNNMKSKYKHTPTGEIYSYNKNTKVYHSEDLTKIIPLTEIQIKSNPFMEEIKEQKDEWISVKDAWPRVEGYCRVKYEDGTEDQKPYRHRPGKGIRGFMSEKNVTHWKNLRPLK